jgi:hypothetical protein
MSEKHDRINMPGQVDYIIENRIKTRKISRRNTLSPGVKIIRRAGKSFSETWGSRKKAPQVLMLD